MATQRVTVEQSGDGSSTSLTSLREGDPTAFRELVGELNPLLLHVAAMRMSRALAEEVVQETWLAVVRSIDRFEERSSLKTWIFRILMNKARTIAERESRIVPFSAVIRPGDPAGGAVEANRFDPDGEFAGHWSEPPPTWTLPEARLERAELLEVVGAAIASLPVSQREVVELRDVHDWDPEDICNALSISAVNQRVLLHRGRAAIRTTIERYLTGE